MASPSSLQNVLVVAVDWLRSHSHDQGLLSALFQGRTSGPIHELQLALGRTAELEVLRDAHVYAGDTIILLNHERLAEWLALLALRRTPDHALGALQRFLAREPLTATATLALARVGLSAPFDLGRGVHMLPFSPQEFLGRAPTAEIDSAEIDVRHISAALSVQFEQPGLWETQASPQGHAAARAAAAPYFDALRRAYRALLVMSIVRPQPPALVGRALFVATDLPGASSPSLSSHVEIDTAWPRFDPTPAELAEAAELFQYLEALPDDRREDMLMPLRRLRSAMTETKDFADAAIDLGIALESMLLKPDEMTEITYRLSMRGAAVLGSTTEERLELRKRLAAIYRMRSSAAHRGGVPLKIKGAGGGETDVLLHDGFRLTSAAIKKLLRSSYPDDLDEVVLRVTPAP